MQKRHGRLANYLPFGAGVTFVATQTKLAGKVVVISAGHLIGNHLNPPIFPVHFDIGMSLKGVVAQLCLPRIHIVNPCG